MRGREAGLAPDTTPLLQARSQKFAMGGRLFGGSRGGAPSRRRPMGAGDLGAKPPAAGGKAKPPALKNFEFFLRK